jgi:hypothetical protein
MNASVGSGLSLGVNERWGSGCGCLSVRNVIDLANTHIHNYIPHLHSTTRARHIYARYPKHHMHSLFYFQLLIPW